VPLLNYSTKVSVEETHMEIARMLAKAGATHMVTQYDAFRPSGLSFVIKTAWNTQEEFVLPAKWEPVQALLRQQYRQGKIAPRFAEREQAERVAWRIVKDWVEAQLALVETGMVKLEEVFLPYMLAGPDKKPLYIGIQEHRLALTAGTTEGTDEG